MTDIRDNTIHCEVRKISYRQSKDGVVVSFVIHPNDVPQTLATAELGSRYMLALVQLNDDESPKEVVPGDRRPQPSTGQDKTTPGVATDQPRRAVAPEKKLTQQAGICCGDPMFRRFLYERNHTPSMTEESAIEYVHVHCGVNSRKDITPGSVAAIAWRDLHADFEAWKLL